MMPQKSSRPMIAYNMMTNMTRMVMCKSGIMARNIELSTTCKLGTPLTSLSGRSTRMARSDLKSKLVLSGESWSITSVIELTILKFESTHFTEWHHQQQQQQQHNYEASLTYPIITTRKSSQLA